MRTGKELYCYDMVCPAGFPWGFTFMPFRQFASVLAAFYGLAYVPIPPGTSGLYTASKGHLQRLLTEAFIAVLTAF